MIDVKTLLDEDDALELTRFNDINLLVPVLQSPVRALWQLLNTPQYAPTHNWGVFETWRSGTRQLKLLAAGTTKTSLSAHNMGLAVDFVPVCRSTGHWFWERSDAGVEARWDLLDSAVATMPILSKPIAWDRPHVEHRNWNAIRKLVRP